MLGIRDAEGEQGEGQSQTAPQPPAPLQRKGRSCRTAGINPSTTHNVTRGRSEGRADLHQPAPEALDPVPGGRLVVGVGLDLLQARDEVHVLWADGFALEVQTGADVEDGEEGEGEVVRDEDVGRPAALEEDGEAGEL